MGEARRRRRFDDTAKKGVRVVHAWLCDNHNPDTVHRAIGLLNQAGGMEMANAIVTAATLVAAHLRDRPEPERITFLAGLFSVIQDILSQPLPSKPH
jgi:hypothetical protein